MPAPLRLIQAAWTSEPCASGGGVAAAPIFCSASFTLAPFPFHPLSASAAMRSFSPRPLLERSRLMPLVVSPTRLARAAIRSLSDIPAPPSSEGRFCMPPFTRLGPLLPQT